MSSQWTVADVPDQHGRTVVITGANSGIGFEAAKALAERGATLVLACRDTDRAGQEADHIRADVETTELDLASLASARAAAARIRAAHPRIDLLINNAGLMIPPYGRTEDGFELPTLRAAVDQAVCGGDYYGPDGRTEQTGHPKLVESNALSHDTVAARRLWMESERLTGVSYPFVTTKIS